MGWIASAHLSGLDPEAAFRARLRRDRAKLLRLSKALNGPCGWRKVAVPVAEMERVAHGLAGASGIFGFARLGDDAARLERLLERWRLRPPKQMSPQRLAAFRRRLVSVIEKLEAAAAP